MTRVFGDPVDVWTSDGRPVRFVWRGRLYRVRRVLEHWVTTRDWWREQHPDGEATGEREFWRVEAGAGRSANPGVYDLCFDWTANRWQLVQVMD